VTARGDAANVVAEEKEPPMTRMRWILILSLIVLLFAAAIPNSGVAAQAATTTPIKGFAPYILGTPTAAVLGADRELRHGPYPLWARGLATRQYGRSLIFSIGGRSYLAVLGLQFWQERLAAVIVQWPASSFDSLAAWREAAAALRPQLRTTYAAAHLKQFELTSESVWSFDLADADGNSLSAWSIDRPYIITVAYLWGPYVKALESAAPDGGY
jgi:hypothetical protein